MLCAQYFKGTFYYIKDTSRNVMLCDLSVILLNRRVWNMSKEWFCGVNYVIILHYTKEIDIFVLLTCHYTVKRQGYSNVKVCYSQ